MTMPSQFFLTAYDPSELPGGSVDPLGFETGYIRLADEFLPGFTTVTDTPRYLSMLCAAIFLATDENERALEDRFAEADAMKRILRLERLWAVSAVLNIQVDAKSGNALPFTIRGVSFAKDEAGRIAAEGRTSIDPDGFRFLKHQRTAGGLGAYKTMLERFGLLMENEWKLTADSGVDLATAFIEPIKERAGKLRAVVNNGDTISVARLRSWGAVAHPFRRLPEKERKIIVECLNGNPRRALTVRITTCLARHLKSEFTTWDELSALKEALREIRALRVKKQDEISRDAIEAALRVAIPYEQTYQAMSLLLDRMLWLAKRLGSAVDIDVAASDDVICEAQETLAKSCGKLEAARNNEPALGTEAAAAIAESVRSALRAAEAKTTRECLEAVLERHRVVQSQKKEMGRHKKPWLEREDGKLKLTSTVDWLDKEPKTTDDIVPHSYRLTNLMRFGTALGLWGG